jgi:hypothetical protein
MRSDPFYNFQPLIIGCIRQEWMEVLLFEVYLGSYRSYIASYHSFVFRQLNVIILFSLSCS